MLDGSQIAVLSSCLLAWSTFPPWQRNSHQTEKYARHSMRSRNNYFRQGNLGLKKKLSHGGCLFSVAKRVGLYNTCYAFSPPITVKPLMVKKAADDDKACLVCYEYEACIVFTPCGHKKTCPNCAVVLESCPICRAKIVGHHRVKWLLKLSGIYKKMTFCLTVHILSWTFFASVLTPLASLRL